MGELFNKNSFTWHALNERDFFLIKLLINTHNETYFQ